jgi:hypothetical protein
MHAMIGSARFSDFNDLFLNAKILPNRNDSMQYTAFLILFGQVFENLNNTRLALILVLGVFLPLSIIVYYLKYKYKVHYRYYILFIVFSYPVLFAFFRGNPALICGLYAIVGVLAYVAGFSLVSKFAILFGSLFHPAPLIFSIMYLRDGVKKFFVFLLIVLSVNLFLYVLIDANLTNLTVRIVGSLDLYRQNYIIGNAGDLFNNSIFFLIKLYEYKNIGNIELALTIIPIAIFIYLTSKYFIIFNQYGKDISIFYLTLYLMPLASVVVSPVSADYRLIYLLIPAIMMMIFKCANLSLFLILLILLPKHILFFSNYWLETHPTDLLIYEDLYPGVFGPANIGITINSLLNPVLILLALLLPFKIELKYIQQLDNFFNTTRSKL